MLGTGKFTSIPLPPPDEETFGFFASVTVVFCESELLGGLLATVPEVLRWFGKVFVAMEGRYSLKQPLLLSQKNR